jgi:tetratricopeptide (TPR) repeat protein
MRARVHELAGDKVAADRDRADGMRRQPTDEKSWIARGVARLERDPKAALADFEQALACNPRSRTALQDKAHVLAERLGRTKEAIDVLEKELASYPDSVLARAGRGVLLARLGQRKSAHKDAEESLVLDQTPATLYQVAGIYALTSRIEAEDRRQAFQLLSSALRKGYGFDLLGTDSDLDPIRQDPEFRRLSQVTKALAPSASGVTRHVSEHSR